MNRGYTQLKKLGEGAYGAVYEVEKDGQRYADKEVSQVDLNELDMMRRFDHPNITKCIDFFKADDETFHLIMPIAQSDLSDFIDSHNIEAAQHQSLTPISVSSSSTSPPISVSSSSSLSSNLSQLSVPSSISNLSSPSVQSIHPSPFQGGSGNQLSYKEAVTICYQIGSALRFLHQQKYYHCDLKPQNVLIAQDGKAMLADFGLAFPLEYAQPFCGTPTLTAPEGLQDDHHPTTGNYQYFKQKLIHERVDIFSLGLLFAFVLTGELLLTYDYNKSIATSYQEFFQEKDTRLQNMPISDSWKDLIRQMVEPDTYKRIRTMDEVLSHSVFSSEGLVTPIEGRVISPKVEKRCMVTPVEHRYSNMINSWIIEVCVSNFPEDLAIPFIAVDLFYRYIQNNKMDTKTLQCVGSACGVLATRLFGETADQEDAISVWTHHAAKSFTEKELTEKVNELMVMFEGRFRSITVYDHASSKGEVKMAMLFHMTCMGYRLFSPEYFHQEYMSFQPTSTKIEDKHVLPNNEKSSLITKVNSYSKKLASYTEDDWKLLGPYLMIQIATDETIKTFQPRLERLMREHPEINASASMVKGRIEKLTGKPFVPQQTFSSVMPPPGLSSKKRNFYADLQTLDLAQLEQLIKSKNDPELEDFINQETLKVMTGNRVDARFQAFIDRIQAQRQQRQSAGSSKRSPKAKTSPKRSSPKSKNSMYKRHKK